MLKRWDAIARLTKAMVAKKRMCRLGTFSLLLQESICHELLVQIRFLLSDE